MLHERSVLCHQLEEMSIGKDKSEYKVGSLIHVNSYEY